MRMAYKTREKHNAYFAARNRKRTAEQDFMANLLDMNEPSSILPLVDSVHLCAVGNCRNKPAVMLCWSTWEPVTLCRRHDEMRKARRTK